MANTFSDDINVLGLHRVVIHGTVDDPSNVKNVEILQNDTDAGSARVSANGTWRFTVAPTSNDVDFFKAVVTDINDNDEIIAAGFTLDLNSFLSNGTVVQTQFDKSPIEANVFTPDGSLIIDATSELDFNLNLTLFETGHGVSVTFLCSTLSQTGGNVDGLRTDITNFHVAKASHDFLDLSNSPFSTIAQVLRHTSTFQGSATVHLDKDSTVKLDGVTKAQLAQHRDVFFFG